jgi:putative tryptophan/tyrosine transport system substrate-binding protein
MSKNYIIGLLITLVGACGLYMFFTSRVIPTHKTHIAVVQPISHPTIDEIVAAFGDTCAATCPDVRIDYYNATGDRMILQSTINNLMESSISCLVTFGTDATTLAVSYALERESIKPICFMAAEPSEALKQYPYLTGTRSDFGATHYCKTYAQLFPERTKILLVYDPAVKAGLNAKDAETCIAILRAGGFTITGITIDKPSSIYERTLSGIHQHQPETIMILMDNTVVSGIDALIKLCNEYKLLLFAADHNSCIKGAGAAFGHQEALFGSMAAQLFCTLKESDFTVMPPIGQVQDTSIVVSAAHLAEEGIILSDQLRATIEITQGKII